MTQLPSSGGEASTGMVVLRVAAGRTAALLLFDWFWFHEASDAVSVMTPMMIAVRTRRITPLLNQYDCQHWRKSSPCRQVPSPT